MRVAFVYDNIYPYSVGGVEKRIWELAKRLASNGHEIHLFGMKYWKGEDVVVSDGVYLHGVCKPQELYVNGRRSIKEAIYFAYKVLLPLLKERFDIIDCQNFPYFPCFSAKLAAIMRKSRLVITWHEVWNNYWFEYLGKKGIFGKAVERLATYLTDKIITNSESTKRALGRNGHTKDIKVIPAGIDFEALREISPANESSDVIFVGRLIKEKNVDLLIRAVSHVKKEMPDIRCVIIGNGPERDNLKRLVHKLNLENNILMTGFMDYHEQVLSYVKASKVFVLPSVREGLGIVVLEANACGLPAITVSHPRNAACDLITDGENGFICQLSEEDLAEKILLALDSRGDMVGKCIKSVEKYDWSQIVNLIESFYEKQLHGSKK